MQRRKGWERGASLVLHMPIFKLEWVATRGCSMSESTLVNTGNNYVLLTRRPRLGPSIDNTSWSGLERRTRSEGPLLALVLNIWSKQSSVHNWSLQLAICSTCKYGVLQVLTSPLAASLSSGYQPVPLQSFTLEAWSLKLEQYSNTRTDA